MPVTIFQYGLHGEVDRELDENGNVLVEYTREPDGTLISEHRNGADRFYHFDGDGNTLALTDINGEVTDRFAYNASGETIERTGTTPTPYQFHGRDGLYRDSESGDYMDQGRPLSTQEGRWLTTHRPGISDIAGYPFTPHHPVQISEPSLLPDPIDQSEELTFPLVIPEPGDACIAAARKKQYCVSKVRIIERKYEGADLAGFKIGDFVCTRCISPYWSKCDKKPVLKIEDFGAVSCVVHRVDVNDGACNTCPDGGKDPTGDPID